MRPVRANQVSSNVAHFDRLHLMKTGSMVFLCTSGDWQAGCSQTGFYLGQSRQLTWLLPDRAYPKWWDVTANWCASPDERKDATQAKDSVQEKIGLHAAGNNQVEFDGFQKEEGTFVLKFRRMKLLPVCG
jgi:hypothetical protein